MTLYALALGSTMGSSLQLHKNVVLQATWVGILGRGLDQELGRVHPREEAEDARGPFVVYTYMHAS